MEFTFLWQTFQTKELICLLVMFSIKFHNIVLQIMFDVDKIFWNVYVGQLGGVHNGGQFKRCSLYA